MSFTVILWIVGALIVIAFWEQLLTFAIFAWICSLIGSWIFEALFHNGDLGSTVGICFAIFIGIKQVLQSLGAEYANLFEYGYYILSFPLWALNRLQHILTEPWRYMFKTSWPSDSSKEFLRPVLYGAQIVLYVVTTPLRLFNAFAYNIVVYGMTELYDLFFEVLEPSQWKEGKGNRWRWLYMLPVRMVKYPLYHGALVLMEGAVWTVIDVFIPAITLYHGTDLIAGKCITRKYGYNWTDGTFTASENGWGGLGVYFASRRNVARRYAEDPYRLDGCNPVMIVCRVSLGKIINYSLAPRLVYNNTGPNGRHGILNQYGEENGYVTGEWWNERGGYWEYCMFDWKNRYNHPWRIRPIFVFNFRTGRAQHIDSGLRHWLFSDVVINDIKKSTAFTALVIVSSVIALWAIFYGFNHL